MVPVKSTFSLKACGEVGRAAVDVDVAGSGHRAVDGEGSGVGDQDSGVVERAG